jgi:peptidoglycan/LPS O-acetylase OafA/YrhL
MIEKKSGTFQADPVLDSLRGLAILAVIVHHWLLFVPRGGSLPWQIRAGDLIQDIAGTMVHLFFILSGLGLTLTAFGSRKVIWGKWVERRFLKIVFPYLFVVAISFVGINILYRFSPVFHQPISWNVLFTNLSFLRNFSVPAQEFNPTLWFMPVIVGLYVLFPILLKILKEYGVWVLLLSSAAVTYLSIALCLALGYPVTHQTALPFFFVVEFAFGMFLGKAVYDNGAFLIKWSTFPMFLVGLGLYAVSWGMTRFLARGDDFNDLITAMGVLLITLYLSRLGLRLGGRRFENFFRAVSRQSYLMYLIHGFLILYGVIPLLKRLGVLPLESLYSILVSMVFCGVVFLLAKGLARPMSSLQQQLFKTLT